MVKKILIQKLKNARVEKDRKWVYNLIAWCLKNQKKDIICFQRRIQASVYYAKGKHEDYWNNPRIKRIAKNSNKRCHLKNPSAMIKANIKYRTESKIAYENFKYGRISKKSMVKIEKEIKNALKTKTQKKC